MFFSVLLRDLCGEVSIGPFGGRRARGGTGVAGTGPAVAEPQQALKLTFAKYDFQVQQAIITYQTGELR
jgi:hypothetical protein